MSDNTREHPDPHLFLNQLYIVQNSSANEDIRSVSHDQLYKLSQQPPWTLTCDSEAVLWLYIGWYFVHSYRYNVTPAVTVRTNLPGPLPYDWWTKVPNRRSSRVKKPVQRYTP